MISLCSSMQACCLLEAQQLTAQGILLKVMFSCLIACRVVHYTRWSTADYRLEQLLPRAFTGLQSKLLHISCPRQ